jgi:abequosyltransferase
MIDQNLLSFCIPTSNRGEILEECLQNLIEQIAFYKFDIVISDNCSIDNTEAIVVEYQKKYPQIRYYKQLQPLPVDENFAFVLSKSTSEYTWLIGDSYRIYPDHFKEIIEHCNLKQYPLILLNSFDMIKNIPTTIYSDLANLLKDLGWYLPFMSAYIYHKDVLKNANYRKFYNSNFVQMGIVFDYFELKNFEIYWFSKNAITSTSLKKQSWHNEFLQVFAKNWTEFILSLPRSINLNIKEKCIKDHGRNHNLFTLINLLNFRERGWLSIEGCRKYRVYFKYISIYPWPIVALISIIPRQILTLIRGNIKKG